MPNHCTNILDVTGPATDVERFRVAVGSENPELRRRLKKEIVDSIEELTSKQTLESWEKVNLRRFHEQLAEFPSQEVILDFNGTVPMPEELSGSVSGSESAKPEWQKKKSAELIRKYGFDDWYDWCLNNWGTKWNAYNNPCVTPIEDGLRYTFNTAWGPPTKWLIETAKLFPTLSFVDSWREEGGTAGRLISYTVNEGTMLDEEDLDEIEWMMEYDSDYREEVERIGTCPSQEIIQDLLDDEWEPFHTSLEVKYLERVEDKDLSLLINREWWTQEATELFEERIKNAGKDQQ